MASSPPEPQHSSTNKHARDTLRNGEKEERERETQEDKNRYKVEGKGWEEGDKNTEEWRDRKKKGGGTKRGAEGSSRLRERKRERERERDRWRETG